MFIDEDWKKEQNKLPDDHPGYRLIQPAGQTDKSKQFLYYFIFAMIVVANIALIAGYWYFKTRINDDAIATKLEQSHKPTASTTSGLPDDIGGNGGTNFDLSSSTANLKVEEITFGIFYDPPKTGMRSSAVKYKLPLNIKTDVSNYYDISRKINLDEYIGKINDNGFALMQSEFPAASNNYYGAYRQLAEKKIPVLITSDFLLYYFQNTLKQVFKEIEKNAFYDSIWDINKKLYDISLARYKKRLSEVGLANDQVLEAERQETAYFAVALSLLIPRSDQINKQVNFVDSNKFSENEAEKYFFELPEDLRDDVDKELAGIRRGSGLAKSPIFLYQKDYGAFRVPDNYKYSAKLNNFYLSIKWLNAVFPLYYKNEACPDCLLDYEDWIINMTAANLIAKDIYENPEIKNDWAIVYKFLAFFSGLRKDLTYLQYYNVLEQYNTQNLALEYIFSPENKNRQKDIAALQKKIEGLQYALMEGGINRADPSTKPYIGMRMLQDLYWPNDYLLNSLVGPEMLAVAKYKNNAPVTACPSKVQSGYFRCRSIGYDIVDILNSQAIDANNQYIKANTDYVNYSSNADKIRQQISAFNKNSWNDNVYWVTMDLSRQVLSYDHGQLPSFAQTEPWRFERDVNSALGAWVNVHLPEDNIVSAYEQQQTGGSLNDFTECNANSYIEPNVVLINDLIARNAMLIKILNKLNVTARTNAASNQLKEFDSDLRAILAIAEKELKGNDLSDDNCKFINDFTGRYLVKGSASKEYTIRQKDKNLRVSLDGIKLLAVVYTMNNQKIMAIGPVFNYKEY